MPEFKDTRSSGSEGREEQDGVLQPKYDGSFGS